MTTDHPVRCLTHTRRQLSHLAVCGKDREFGWKHFEQVSLWNWHGDVVVPRSYLRLAEAASSSLSRSVIRVPGPSNTPQEERFCCRWVAVSKFVLNAMQIVRSYASGDNACSCICPRENRDPSQNTNLTAFWQMVDFVLFVSCFSDDRQDDEQHPAGLSQNILSNISNSSN